MRPFARFFLLALLMLVPAVLAAQAPAQPQKPVQNPVTAQANLTLDEIVALNLKARGGAELLRSTESMKMTGTVTSPAGKAKMTNWVMRPNRKRTETEFGGQQAVEAFDGTTAWRSIGGLPPQMLPPSPQLEEAKRQSEIDPVLLDYKERGRSVTLVGREKADGADVYHLRISDRGQVTHYYIDAATGLERKITNRISDGQMSAQVELRFSDFREVQGRMVPFTIQQAVDGKPVAQTRLDSVDFNVPIDEAIFKMPGKAPR